MCRGVQAFLQSTCSSKIWFGSMRAVKLNKNDKHPQHAADMCQGRADDDFKSWPVWQRAGADQTQQVTDVTAARGLLCVDKRIRLEGLGLGTGMKGAGGDLFRPQDGAS